MLKIMLALLRMCCCVSAVIKRGLIGTPVMIETHIRFIVLMLSS